MIWATLVLFLSLPVESVHGDASRPTVEMG